MVHDQNIKTQFLLSDFINRKEHTGFVVCEHDGNYSRIASQGLAQIVKIELTASVDLEPGYFATNFGQMLAKISDCFVLDARGNDVTPGGILFEKAADRPVV